MRRIIIRIGAAAAMLGVGWYLVARTILPLYDAMRDSRAHPDVIWWFANVCTALLLTGMIVLLAAIIVRSPRGEK